jgi:putative transposase
VNGRWCYLYRAIDRLRALVDVRLNEKRDMAAAKAFFRSAKAVTGVTPARATTDGHDSYPRAIRTELDAGVKHRTRACHQLSQTTLATSWTAARKLRAVFS